MTFNGVQNDIPNHSSRTLQLTSKPAAYDDKLVEILLGEVCARDRQLPTSERTKPLRSLQIYARKIKIYFDKI